MSNEKGLQTLTKSESQEVIDTPEKVHSLFKKERIIQEDVNRLADHQRELFSTLVNEKMNSLKEEAFDEFLEKVSAIICEDSKRELWENNQVNITRAIAKCIKDYGRVPTKTEIAKETGISRQTVHKHLSGFNTNPNFASQLEEFRMLGVRVLSTVYEAAQKGDMKAAKLFLQTIGWANGAGQKINIGNQNNYIQVNGTVINEDGLKQLPLEQLNILNEMLKGVLRPATDLGIE
jgi:DNA-binding phage protein